MMGPGTGVSAPDVAKKEKVVPTRMWVTGEDPQLFKPPGFNVQSGASAPLKPGGARAARNISWVPLASRKSKAWKFAPFRNPPNVVNGPVPVPGAVMLANELVGLVRSTDTVPSSDPWGSIVAVTSVAETLKVMTVSA